MTALFPELNSMISHGSDEKRAEALRQLTSLFVAGAPRFNDEHVQVFDNVFLLLVSEIETRARAELANRLAPIGNSPAQLIRRLARDEDITVAGPVLAQSPRLLTADLVDIAGVSGIEHLLAISTRTKIEEPVTDLLVRRGDANVKRSVARNAGARISDGGFNVLVKSAEYDSVLAETVALRDDIPDHMFRDLITRATEVVQHRLLATARPETQEEIRRVLARLSGRFGETRAVPDFSAARHEMQELALNGQLDEAKLTEFAKAKSYDRTVAALSELTTVPVEVVDRLMNGEQPDPILILCKAADFSWPTAKDVILAKLGSRGKSAPALEAALSTFEKLPGSTARRVVRFWQTPAPQRAA